MVSPDFIVGIMGNIVSVLVYAAPVRTFEKVVRKKSVENYDVMPYITTLLCKSLWTFYGALDPHGLLLITVNALGVLSESIYVILYLIYAPKDKMVKTLILVGILNIGFVGLVIALAIGVFHDRSDRCTFMGVLCAAVTIAMYAAPFRAMKSVVKTKSVEYMSFTLSFVQLLNAGCWFTFALLLKDPYVIVPNVIGILLSSALIIFYLTYKNKSPLAKPVVIAGELIVDSLQTIEDGIRMENFNQTKMKNQDLNRGNSLPQSPVCRQYSIQKIMRALSLRPYEHDVENTGVDC